jgi:hypothetical protein
LKTMIQFRIEEMYHVNILSCIGVLRWIIVGSRFDDWVFWKSVLQLQLIITAHTLNYFWIMNFSVLSESQTGL